MGSDPVAVTYRACFERGITVQEGSTKIEKWDNYPNQQIHARSLQNNPRAALSERCYKVTLSRQQLLQACTTNIKQVYNVWQTRKIFNEN